LALRGTREQRSGESYIMRSLMICTPHQILFGDQIEKNEMGRTCSTYGGRGEVHTGFWWGNLREGDHLEGPGIDGKIILRLILRKLDGGHGLD